MWCDYCALRRRSSRIRPKATLLDERIVSLLLIMAIIQAEKPIASEFFNIDGYYETSRGL